MYAVVLLVLVGLALVAAWFVLPLLPFLFRGHTFILLLGLAMIGLPVFYYIVTPEYRAGRVGRPSAIMLSHDCIEVPDTRGAPMRFATQGLALRLVHMRVVYTVALLPVANIARGVVIELASGGIKRRISTLTLVDKAQATFLLADLQRVAAGQDPLGPAQVLANAVAATAKTRDVLEDALDRELAHMD